MFARRFSCPIELPLKSTMMPIITGTDTDGTALITRTGFPFSRITKSCGFKSTMGCPDLSVAVTKIVDALPRTASGLGVSEV